MIKTVKKARVFHKKIAFSLNKWEESIKIVLNGRSCFVEFVLLARASLLHRYLIKVDMALMYKLFHSVIEPNH